MMHLVKMRRHVAVRRVVTAQRDPAGLTDTEVQPMTMDLDAFLAYMFFFLFDLSDGTEVLTYLGLLAHEMKLSLF